MDNNGNKILMGLDVSTKTIGVTVLIDDKSDNGKIIEMTHISPKVSKKISNIESLCIKKKIFDEFIKRFVNIGIDDVIIEEPLLSSNNEYTVGTLLRFNGMLTSSIYDLLNIAPKYISSYDARKYAFPELMGIRKYNKSGKQYEKKKILKEIKDSKVVLFGSYPWDVAKKEILQQKVADIFPQIPWIMNKKGELKEENFDATDSYVAVLGYMNKIKNGEPEFKITNINDKGNFIEYDLNYWNKTDHRVTYLDSIN